MKFNRSPQMSNQFQDFDLENSGYWKDVAFHKDEDSLIYEQLDKLSASFDEVVRNGGIIRFVREYVSCARSIIEKSKRRKLLRQILIEGLRRLLISYKFLRRKTRSNMNETGMSVRHWALDTRIIQAAIEQASAMERANIAVQDFDLDSAPEFKKWLMDTIQPIVSSYVGGPAIMPWAQIRYVDTLRHGHEWSDIYKNNEYGYFHWDEFCYSLPTIVYLDDVDEDCGPFTYVDGSDKLTQNYVLRSLHQAVCHTCKISPLSDKERAVIGSLPQPLRGGDLLGAFAEREIFENADIKVATGSAGLVSLFEGYKLVHAGGHPKSKSRKALFVAFRYPTKKIDDIYGWVGHEFVKNKIL